MIRPTAALAGLLLCAAATVWLWPRAHEAAQLLLAQDDSVALTEARLATLRGAEAVIPAQIEAALTTGDADLAASFVALAQAQGEVLPEALSARVADAVAADTAPMRQAGRFASGFVTGEADDIAGLSGIVAGDLFVFGDLRDAVREGGRLAAGDEADTLILGLAAAGLAVTAATYATAGAMAPLRAGLTVAKGARRAGRLSEPLAQWGMRAGREAVDLPVLRQAMATASVLQPARSMRAVRAAFNTGRAGALLRFGKDIGRVAGKAGGRGAMDVLKVAQGPKDVARAARLAEARGSQTRAIVKLFGRGALVLVSGAFHLAAWLFGLAWAMLGMIVSLKSAVERLTQRWCVRRRQLRARLRSVQPSRAPPALAGAA